MDSINHEIYSNQIVTCIRQSVDTLSWNAEQMFEEGVLLSGQLPELQRKFARK